MSDFSILYSPAPYHIISYGTLLGSSFYQSFVNGIVSYRALPRAQFSTLQEKLTPVYFAIQTALPIAMAITYPAVRGISPLGGQLARNGLYGVFEERNRWTVLMPLAGIMACNVANWLWLGPTTTRVMKTRKHQGMYKSNTSKAPRWREQLLSTASYKPRLILLGVVLETKDGKKSYDEGPHSHEMERLNKSFGMWHGASALVNLAGLGVTIWYGFLLAERLQ